MHTFLEDENHSDRSKSEFSENSHTKKRDNIKIALEIMEYTVIGTIILGTIVAMIKSKRQRKDKFNFVKFIFRTENVH